MQRYMLNFKTPELPQAKCDCLIIGSGVAGLMTAIHAAEEGLDVIVAVKDTLEDSNSNKAQGGIAAAFGDDDAPKLHAADTFVAGAGLCQEDIVKMVVSDGPLAVKDLIAMGAVFDRKKDGSLSLGREGCHSRHRILHAKGDATGAEVIRSLLAAVKKHPNIKILEHTYIVDVLTRSGRSYGALAIEQNKRVFLRAGAVVLATGGAGRLFEHTTNPEGASGSGLAIAYRAGAELSDLEFVQFHPTALALKGCPNFLISEAVRGEGAFLRNEKGKRFMPKYHPLAELAPRDVVARAIFCEMGEKKDKQVYLDATKIDAVEKRFPMIAATCKQYGLNIEKQWIPIAPAAHYMMGGVRTDAQGKTNIKGLFACGEAACTGLHGANRLASNSLLEGLVFGKRVTTAIREQKDKQIEDFDCQYDCLVEKACSSDVPELQKKMSRYLGIVREQAGLEALCEYLRGQQAALEGTAALGRKAMEYRNMLIVAGLMTDAALKRKESRGAHYRRDFMEKEEVWQKHIIERWQA